MSLFKRAYLCMKRNLIQSIILFFILLVLGIFVSGSISIGRAIERTEEHVWHQLPAVVMVSEDFIAAERHWQAYNEWAAPRVTVEMVEQVARLPYVQTMEIVLGNSIFTRDLSRYVGVNPPRVTSSLDDYFCWTMVEMERFAMHGVSRSNFLELNHDVIEIIQGSTFTEEQIEMGMPVVIISRELATVNNLEIGSTITLEEIVTRGIHDWTERWFDDSNIVDSMALDFEVIGIYEFIGTTSDDFNDVSEKMEILNALFVPYTIVVEMRTVFTAITLDEWYFNPEDGEWYFSSEEAQDFVETTFVPDNFLLLYDARYLPAFREAALEILPEFITVIDTAIHFSDVMTSMENIRGVSMMMSVLIVSASVVALSLVIFLLLRERHREIGIYLALGEHKKRIVMQFIFEIFCITLVAATLSLFVGSFLSTNISRSMLSQELSAVRDTSNEDHRLVQVGSAFISLPIQMNRFAPEPLPVETLMELFDTSIDSSEILIFYGVAIATVFLSTIVPTMYVMRLKPKELLISE